MAKPFFEVFPTLQLKQEQKDLMEQTRVARISTTKAKDFLRIYLESDRLILKDAVFAVEGEIKKQLFPNANMVIKIYEKFQLSSQYNPQKLYEIYEESIFSELREYSHVLHSILKKAEVLFPEEGGMSVMLEDTVLARSKAEELLGILDKIFNERCGMNVTITAQYREADEGRFKEEDERKIALQVAQISARVKGFQKEASGEGVSDAGGGDPQKQTGAAKKAMEVSLPGKKSGGYTNGEKKAGGFAGRKEFTRGTRKSENPDVIYGRDVEDEPIRIEDIVGEVGEVVIRGKILNFDKREIKNEKTILFFDITDFTDTMTVKIFVRNDQVEEIVGGLKPGTFVKVKGLAMMDKFDHELTIGSIAGIQKIPDFTSSRMDFSVRKRVELHCHTKMSDMDGVSEAKDIVKRAYQWGHPAIAITDHGVVQAFPDANHVWEDLWKKEKDKRKEAGDKNPDYQDFFKIIYGVEAYIVDDLKEIVTKDKGQELQGSYVVFDIETTGFSPVNNKIIEIGAVRVEGGRITARYSTFVNPEVPIPYQIEKLTGIRDDMVLDAPKIDKVLPEFLDFCQDAVLVAHNAGFDMSFILENAGRLGLEADFTYVDTVGISRVLLTGQSKHTLDAVAKTLGVSLENHHRAVDDAEATADIFVKFIGMLEKEEITTLSQVNALGVSNPDMVKKLPTYHAIILAKNNTGRVNMYTLISESHLTYYSTVPEPDCVLRRFYSGGKGPKAVFPHRGAEKNVSAYSGEGAGAGGEIRVLPGGGPGQAG